MALLGYRNLMHILVTGATGFIGQNLVPQLIFLQHNVTAVVRSPSPSVDAKADILVADLAHPSESLREALRHCEVVIHLANDTTPRTSASSLIDEAHGSLLPTLNLLELVRSSSNSPLFLYASSGGTVYGRPIQTPIDESHPTYPTSPYGIGKLACEHMLRITAERLGIHYYILRISNPYGPHQHTRRKQGVIGAWINAALAGNPLEIWGDGSVTKDYIHVRDVVEAFTSIIQYTPAPGIYNLGSGSGANLLEIAGLIGAQLPHSPRIIHLPAPDYDVKLNILDVRKLQGSIPWTPHTCLDKGIAETFQWMKSLHGSHAENKPPRLPQCL